MSKIKNKLKVNLKWFGGAFMKWIVPLMLQKTFAELGRVTKKLAGKK
jgi:hypothetical protein